MSDDLPLVKELHPPPDPEAAFRQLANQPHCLFLDSAMRHDELGRYSFVACDPFEFVSDPPAHKRGRESFSDDRLPTTHDYARKKTPDPLTRLQERLGRFTSETLPELPPFQGGAAGLFSYDLNRSLERLPRPQHDEFQSPALAVGLYDVVLAMDHAQERAWIISQGWPEADAAARVDRAASRLQWLEDCLADSVESPPMLPAAKPLSPNALGRYLPTTVDPELISNFSKPTYMQAVERAIEYIHAGDVFQVNLSQRLLYPAHDDSIALYLRLRERNPATFAAYFNLGDFQIVSASPERFIQVRDRQVEARPIKGTRQRTALPEADLFAADDLRQSEKDRAENVMIVDLLRNDISRVCCPDSVRVTQLCELEVYEYVQHLVSAIRGELAAGKNAIDVLRATFPGGSITGAPKVRAMEIIAELEPTARGPYCGSLGYVGFDGSMDLSILIRTITAGRGWWQFPVGGGIVAQSDPQQEYEETWHKATGMLKALR